MKTGRAQHDLRGPVKSVRVEMTQFKEEDGQRVEQPWFAHTITFDPEGNTTEYAHRNPDGSAFRTVNDYSATGELLAVSNYDPSDQLIDRAIYVYDDGGRLTAEQTIAQDGTRRTPSTYAYDAEGRRTKTQILDEADGGVMIGIEDTHTAIAATEVRTIRTRYDERGHAVEVVIFNSEGSLISRVEITRDPEGRPLAETQFSGDVTPFGSCPVDPGDAGREQPQLTAEQQAEFEAEIVRLFAPGTPTGNLVYTYDERGLLVEERLTMMGMQVSRRVFIYDEAGNKLEEVNYDEQGRVQSKTIFTRRFDEQGNWTEEVVSTGSAWDAEFGLSTPQHVTRRTIDYY